MSQTVNVIESALCLYALVVCVKSSHSLVPVRVFTQTTREYNPVGRSFYDVNYINSSISGVLERDGNLTDITIHERSTPHCFEYSSRATLFTICIDLITEVLQINETFAVRNVLRLIMSSLRIHERV